MASRGARRQLGRLRGETNLRLGAKETETQGLAGIHAPSPRRPDAETGLKFGAKVTENQGLAGFRAPTPRRPDAETGLRLGAKETEEQGFAGFRAPSPRRPSLRRPIPRPADQARAGRAAPRYENNLHRLARWRTGAGCFYSIYYIYSNSKAPVYSW